MGQAERTRRGVRKDGQRAKHLSPVKSHLSRAGKHFLWLASLVFLFSVVAPADAPDIAVQLDISKAAPRKIEPQTAGRILADYRVAWADISRGLNANDSGPFNAVFVGAAKKSLDARVADQQRSGVTTQYSNQTHQLQAVFYAPEGDLIELHDTAELDTQLRASGKVIHEDHGVHRYIVLMTPAADRWVIRELTEVSQF
jgi:hypothetical protein